MRKHILLVMFAGCMIGAFSACTHTKNNNEETPDNVKDDTVSSQHAIDLTTEEDTSLTHKKDEAHWDELLNLYEKGMKTYVSQKERANKGDVEAQATCAKLQIEIQHLQTLLENGQGDLTSAQMARIDQITAQTTTAMAASQQD